MTLDDFNFAPPPYRCTISDNNGHPIATGFPDGTIQYLPASNLNKTDKDGNTVVWDGTNPDKLRNGRTKGRLLPVKGPRYIDSLVAYAHMAVERYDTYIEDVTGEEKAAKYGIKKSKKSKKKKDQK